MINIKQLLFLFVIVSIIPFALHNVLFEIGTGCIIALKNIGHLFGFNFPCVDPVRLSAWESVGFMVGSALSCATFGCLTIGSMMLWKHLGDKFHQEQSE